MIKLCVFLIKGYQKWIRPIFPPSCRFVPSCSEYCIEAIRKRGVVIGLSKGIYRIMRCNPYCKSGYDPVKE